jgi:plasmid maintenance system antidote protein VapI
MKEKLEILLREKRHTATSLARLLEIQPSAISHILSGRNKPSFDLVVKILRLFPDINPDWLLLDGSEMLRSSASSESVSHSTTLDIFTAPSEPLFDVDANIESVASENSTKNSMPAIFQSVKNGGKRVERIIILYSDRTFETYTE